MRPKPLMATLTAASVVVLTAAACDLEGVEGQRKSRHSQRTRSGRRVISHYPAGDSDDTHLDGLAALEAGGLAAKLNLFLWDGGGG
tara:strand:- start:23940 stop:24197 length:258 start_codon:yes stop_codon:yes gene_type:complete